MVQARKPVVNLHSGVGYGFGHKAPIDNINKVVGLGLLLKPVRSEM